MIKQQIKTRTIIKERYNTYLKKIEQKAIVKGAV